MLVHDFLTIAIGFTSLARFATSGTVIEATKVVALVMGS